MPTLAVNSVRTSYRAQHRGPFEIGTNLYIVVNESNVGADKLRMYKSTDDGTTWIEKDPSNAPSTYKTGGFSRFRSDTQQDGATLYVGYIETGGTLNIIAFSSTTDTWGTIISGGPSIASTSNYMIFSLVRRVSGEYMVFWSDTYVASYTGVQAALYSGGAWGVPFSTSATAGLVGACSDSTGRTYVFMWYPDSVYDHQIQCRTYTYPGNVLSSVIIVCTDNTAVGAGGFISLPVIYTPTNGIESICLSYARTIRYPLSGGGIQAEKAHTAFAISPIGDSPVFTTEEVSYLNTPVGFGSEESQDLLVIPVDGEPYVLWVTPGRFPRAAVYNFKDGCSMRWQKLNTSLVNNIVDPSLPSDWDYVGLIEGRYLSTREKVGILIYTYAVSPLSGYQLYYMEL